MAGREKGERRETKRKQKRGKRQKKKKDKGKEEKKKTKGTKKKEKKKESNPPGKTNLDTALRSVDPSRIISHYFSLACGTFDYKYIGAHVDRAPVV
ncbi:hypothetical protein ANTQUA_LOCUS437 [Anthophora quadrimaculata]